jgi:hypothetical protein
MCHSPLHLKIIPSARGRHRNVGTRRRQKCNVFPLWTKTNVSILQLQSTTEQWTRFAILGNLHLKNSSKIKCTSTSFQCTTNPIYIELYYLSKD